MPVPWSLVMPTERIVYWVVGAVADTFQVQLMSVEPQGVSALRSGLKPVLGVACVSGQLIGQGLPPFVQPPIATVPVSEPPAWTTCGDRLNVPLRVWVVQLESVKSLWT